MKVGRMNILTVATLFAMLVITNVDTNIKTASTPNEKQNDKAIISQPEEIRFIAALSFGNSGV